MGIVCCFTLHLVETRGKTVRDNKETLLYKEKIHSMQSFFPAESTFSLNVGWFFFQKIPEKLELKKILFS